MNKDVEKDEELRADCAEMEGALEEALVKGP